MGHWSIAMDRMLAFRRDPTNDARFFDIGFSEFQADPISQIRRLYGWLGDELAPATVERMRAWRADNPKTSTAPTLTTPTSSASPTRPWLSASAPTATASPHCWPDSIGRRAGR